MMKVYIVVVVVVVVGKVVIIILLYRVGILGILTKLCLCMNL